MGPTASFVAVFKPSLVSLIDYKSNPTSIMDLRTISSNGDHIGSTCILVNISYILLKHVMG